MKLSHPSWQPGVKRSVEPSPVPPSHQLTAAQGDTPALGRDLEQERERTERFGHHFDRLSATRPEAPSQPLASGAHKTGLPARLKSNIEAMAGVSLDGVRVHYGSQRPKQLEALAYTQGTEIHVAPGQEAHLPHEAWHVVQQMRGRVKPSGQLGQAAINDEPRLEQEAETMGARALSASLQPLAAGATLTPAGKPGASGSPGAAPIQRKSKAFKRRRQRKLEQEAAIRNEFRTADPTRRDELLQQHFQIPTNVSPQKQARISQRLLKKTFGLNKKQFPGSNASMDGWHNDHAEIVGGHHKFPKRSLGYLYGNMPEQHRKQLREQLHLDPDAGHTALARLRSNIIPRGPNAVAPEMRGDDPEHTHEGLDTVVTDSGAMSPRSRTYVSMAEFTRRLHQRLKQLPQGTEMSNEEAEEATSHLRKAEEQHHAIEGHLNAADYGNDFWKRQGNGKYIKGHPPAAKYANSEPVAGAFDTAHQERQDAMRQRARESAQQKRDEKRRQEEESMARLRERWARDSARHHREKQEGTHDPSVGRDAIGKSARFW